MEDLVYPEEKEMFICRRDVNPPQRAQVVYRWRSLSGLCCRKYLQSEVERGACLQMHKIEKRLLISCIPYYRFISVLRSVVSAVVLSCIYKYCSAVGKNWSKKVSIFPDRLQVWHTGLIRNTIFVMFLMDTRPGVRIESMPGSLDAAR